MSKDVFMLLDLETTGLDPASDFVLEVAAAPLDMVTLTLKDIVPFSEVCHFQREKTDTFHPVVEEMHMVNGLWRECAEATLSMTQVFTMLEDYFKDCGATERNVVLVGNSVHFDRGFLTHKRGYQPLVKLLSHRIVDVRTLMYAAEHWTDAETPDRPDMQHRALHDITGSLNLIRWCRKALQGGI